LRLVTSPDTVTSDLTTQCLARLKRPADFQRTYPNIFRTDSALRYHLSRRHTNGLLAAGAVVETRLGLRIDPPALIDWVFDRRRGAPSD
jgi:hypothetical protein